jgi:alkaline phosphatase D
MSARRRRLTAVRALVAVVGVLGAAPACAPADPSGAAPPIEAPDRQAASGGVNAARWRDAPYVVLLSLDGFAAAYLDRYRPPHLLELAARGVRAADGMIPVYPSKTFPNHYSIATGLYPEHHGIVANTFWDPERRATYRIGDRAAVEDGSWYGGEPIWVTAERQGMVAASYYWVGSEADVGGVRPSFWRRYDEAVSPEERVDQVLAWLAHPPERRPHLIAFYLSDTDDVGHGHGPASPEIRSAVARVDAAVGRLVEGLRALPHGELVHVIVVSDHGMDGFTPGTHRFLEDVVGTEGLRMPEAGPSGNVWVDGGPERARRVRDSINAGLEGVTAYLRAETPARLHYRDHARIGNLVLVTDSAVVVHRGRDGMRVRAGFTHGWDPAITTMRALFVAAGPAFRPGTEVEPFENVHVYPLIARLLGLTPAPGLDGDPAFWGGVVRPR